ncbi:GNAT family N-acetyltransferase [Ensifer sp. 1H6]|uniref:GNAT family N-acetyltransferase n=1 Tax=Ensifer sp. 1H6 TaxID=1911585 RepID=UPI0009D5E5AC|nr:GNAT family N-acetyltransferase [Ensifer sp. 1H6]OMQ39799.1 hypothetical protein BKP54_31015 [Ensifer sp. 1H6]
MPPVEIAEIGFPARRDPSRLSVANIALRRATSEDFPFLLQLYRSFRADELAAVPWSIEQKHAFLQQQFLFQHRHYIATFPDADFLVVEIEGEPVGRVYLDATKERWLIVDIGLLTEWRRQGHGTTLLAAIQHEATVSDCEAVVLHVEQHNFRAQALYHRLGFRAEENGGSHVQMEWSCCNLAETGRL